MIVKLFDLRLSSIQEYSFKRINPTLPTFLFTTLLAKTKESFVSFILHIRHSQTLSMNKESLLCLSLTFKLTSLTFPIRITNSCFDFVSPQRSPGVFFSFSFIKEMFNLSPAHIDLSRRSIYRILSMLMRELCGCKILIYCHLFSLSICCLFLFYFFYCFCKTVTKTKFAWKMLTRFYIFEAFASHSRGHFRPLKHPMKMEKSKQKTLKSFVVVFLEKLQLNVC